MATQNNSINSTIENLLFNLTTPAGEICSNKSAGQELEEPWDTYKKWKVGIEVGVVTPLCLFGFIGNALSVAVLCKDKDRKNATNWLLQTLAVVDTIYLFSCLFIQPLSCITNQTNWIPELKKIFPYFELYIWAFGSIAATATVWMVLLVTIDRYIAICKPLNTQLRSIKRAKFAVALVAFLAITYNIPRFFERKLIFTVDSCTNVTTVRANKTALRIDNYYIMFYKTIAYNVCRSLGPLCVLIWLNLQLISALRLVRRKQKEMTKRHKNRNENITMMLVAVVSVFIICEIPDSVLRIIYTIHMKSHKNLFKVRNLRYCNIATNLLLTINSSINFIIYCLIGKKFRRILKSMCCCGSSIGGVMFEATETEPLTMKATMNTVLLNNGVNCNKQTTNDQEVPV